MEISGRKLAILKVIIDDYITTGVPIGSRTISKKPGMELSSATIRNEMADLEELGFLEQPHTSAGRIPSDKAYRLYVDKMMRAARLTAEESNYIRNYFTSRMNQIEDVISNTADIISDTTRQISMVLTPQIQTAAIKRIQLVRIDETKALLLIVTSTGLVKDSIIRIPPDIDNSYLEMISNVLTQNTYDKTLAQAKAYALDEFKDDIRNHSQFISRVLDAIDDGIDSKKSVVLGGAGNIFRFPEYQDVDKAKNFLQILETKEMLYSMLKKATELEFSIRIGKENEFEEMKDMSVVTATYKIGGKALGSFGVIGPTRMNYAKVVALLNHIGNSLNGILSNFIDDDEGKRR